MSRDTNSAVPDSILNQRRRRMLKALGGGAALSTFAGVSAASEHEDTDADDETSDGWCPPCIDRLAGYTALPGEEEIPAQPDHTVDMYIEPRHVLFAEAPTDDADVDPGVDPTEDEELPEAFPDFFFDPVGLHVETGAVVEFFNESDLHTISAIHPRFFGMQQRVPDGAHPFSSPPVMFEERWFYRFDEPGVYDLFCLPHLELGMVMRLVVGDEGCPAPEAEPLPDPGPEGFPPAIHTVFSAPELEPTNIIEQGSVAWDDLTIEERLDPATVFGEE